MLLMLLLIVFVALFLLIRATAHPFTLLQLGDDGVSRPGTLNRKPIEMSHRKWLIHFLVDLRDAAAITEPL